MSRSGGGAGLAARFTLVMAGALAGVGAAGAWVLVGSTAVVTERHAEEVLQQAVNLSLSAEVGGYVETDSQLEKLAPALTRQPVRVAGHTPARLYRATAGEGEGRERAAELFVPVERPPVRDVLLGLIVPIVLAMLLVGVAVAWWAATQVTHPLQAIIKAVRQISLHDPRYRGRVTGGGSEIASLTRALDRMSEELLQAREAELELSAREREMELASEVRGALLPLTTPLLQGFDFGAFHLAGPELDGTFHDYLEHEDGRVGLLVCDVGARGLPGALIGATARAFLHSVLRRGGDVAAAFAEVNQELARDVLRGTYVTALYVVLEPSSGAATVACAGHRIPLIRISAADGKLRVFHPAGLALGLDKGPVFARRLEVQQLEVAPGDRLVLASATAVELTAADGAELGEKGFYQLVLRHAARPTDQFLRHLRTDLEQFAADSPLPGDVSIVSVGRS
jgi:serine phosphatase RsbU (regulator of sigma subunit)